MTAEQQLAFADTGYIFLKDALGERTIAPIRKFVFEELKRLRVWSSGKIQSASIKGLPAFQQIAKLSSAIRIDDLGAKLVTADLLSTINALGGGRARATHSQFLISLPNQGPWSLENLNWHTDIARTVSKHVPGVQAFVLVDDVKPRGGATLALAGSHRLEDAAHRKVRALLREGGKVESALHPLGLSIVEMCGEAGDVYLMDMRILHTPSINATGNVRVMATVRHVVA